MKRYAQLAFTFAAALALSACGSSESAKEEAQPDNVEMPAEEAMGDVAATPVADPSANAVDAAPATDAAPAVEPAPAPTAKPQAAKPKP
ncbi:MAG: hypothetical protein JSR96_10490 [Proteobacteria bacterium]|nr:hypothetical protein [Pseudomonadota bacterium]